MTHSLKRALAICTLACLTGCASSGSRFDEVDIPTETEITAYVTANWSVYEDRVSRFASRTGQRSDLVSVSEVDCFLEYGIRECLFTVVAKFPDGSVFQRQLFSQFDRDEHGALFETIVLIHERAR